MEILTEFPATISEHTAVVTIGNFDGCHRGHQRLFNQCLSYCQADNQHRQVVITFNNPTSELLFSPEQKLQALAGYGFNTCVIKELNSEFASISHTDFLHDYLLNKLNMKVLVAGTNFRFGHNRLGNADYLRGAEQTGKSFKFAAIELLYNDADDRVSSSNIRSLLRAGDVAKANAMLGYAFTLTGIVVKGSQRGRQINTPTLNLAVDSSRIVPKTGVYIGAVSVDSSTYTCAINIGTRPTVSPNASDEVIEAHAVDAQLPQLYGNKLKLEFHQRLRPEIKFANIQALKQQIQQDIQAARQAICTTR